LKFAALNPQLTAPQDRIVHLEMQKQQLLAQQVAMLSKFFGELYNFGFHADFSCLARYSRSIETRSVSEAAKAAKAAATATETTYRP
jgi:hypothetical protein